MDETTARADTFKPGVMKRYTEAWGHQGSLTAMLNHYRALREREKPNPPARIWVPTLVIWGEHDSFPEHHVAWAALELCDQGQLSVIQGGTRWLHLEETARVNAEILGFLSRDA